MSECLPTVPVICQHPSPGQTNRVASKPTVPQPVVCASKPVLGPSDPFTNAVFVTLSRLRRKLGDPPVIETRPGVGYRIGQSDGDRAR